MSKDCRQGSESLDLGLAGAGGLVCGKNPELRVAVPKESNVTVGALVLIPCGIPSYSYLTTFLRTLQRQPVTSHTHFANVDHRGARAEINSLTVIQGKITSNGRNPSFHRNPPTSSGRVRETPPGQGRRHGYKWWNVYISNLVHDFPAVSGAGLGMMHSQECEKNRHPPLRRGEAHLSRPLHGWEGWLPPHFLGLRPLGRAETSEIHQPGIVHPGESVGNGCIAVNKNLPSGSRE